MRRPQPKQKKTPVKKMPVALKLSQEQEEVNLDDELSLDTIKEIDPN
jgi:hypothetical protein